MRQESACSLSGTLVTSTLYPRNHVSSYFPVSLTGANIGGFLGGTVVLPVPWEKMQQEEQGGKWAGVGAGRLLLQPRRWKLLRS